MTQRAIEALSSCVAKRDPQLRQTIAGLVKRQMTLILKDPYANSFNIEENWKGHHETDHTDLNGWIWERKYEVDSLCYPLQLAYLLWKETGETSQFDETFITATKEILHLWTVEQDHKNSLIALFGIQIVRKTRW